MYHPVFLDLDGAPCLVVGGGAIALRKARSLRRAGARVTVVSPRFRPAFRRLKVRRVARRFRAADATGMTLVVSATGDDRADRAVHRACRTRRIPVNVVDVPELCTFIAPSVVRRGPVTIAISTGGASPALAKELRRRLERMFPESLGPTARRIGRERRTLMRTLPPSPERTRILKGLARAYSGPGAR